jgi:glycyl-tRNA synthetase
MLSWTKTNKKFHEIKFTPSVIEPSFGMGRILYSLLEHSFYQRDGDDQRCVMKFNPQVAPQKCAVLPISSNPEMNAIVEEIAAALMDSDMSTKVDTSTASLGRRYARADEVGVPFAVTVDFETLSDGTVTLRERDSTTQIRLPKDDVTRLIFDIVHNRTNWEEAKRKYPIVSVDEEGTGSSKPAGGVIVIEKNSRGAFSRPAEKI